MKISFYLFHNPVVIVRWKVYTLLMLDVITYYLPEFVYNTAFRSYK